jgi:hypothetical protein
MHMKSDTLNFLLFPHTVLSEVDIRHFSLLLPQLSILKVVRPPVLPEWSRDQFKAWPVVEKEEDLDIIRLSLKGYQDFADLHGESALTASVSHEHILRGLRESRSQIESELRGKGTGDPDERRRLRIEAAVLIELARNLDENALELEGGITRVETLEEEFREILGITSEEGSLEAAGALSPPLKREKSHLSFMLSKRIASWYRLFSTQAVEGLPILAAVVPEVAEDVLDALRTERERSGDQLKAFQFSAPAFPSLEDLDGESFSYLLQSLRSADVLTAFWRSLEEVLKAPDAAPPLQSLRERAESLAARMNAFLEERARPSRSKVHLTLTCLEDSTHNDLWACVDKDGYSALRNDAPDLGPPIWLIHTA